MKHAFARQLRREQTDVERRLWHALRGRRFKGCKFRRQQPIDPYVVDFVCFQSMLVIELDGDQHGSEHGMFYDVARSRRLARDGFQILRIPNWELMRSLDGILDAIEHALDEPSTPHPQPTLTRGLLPSPTRGEG
jgi:very-short-patch-repair endonuclease